MAGSFDEAVLQLGEGLVSRGYLRKGASFSRTDGGVYRLVHLQRGAHGGGYFFVNLGVSPVGLPRLREGLLAVPDRPKEYECALRQRIDQIAPPDLIGTSRGFFRIEDESGMALLATALKENAEAWFREWADLQRIAAADEIEVAPMLTVVPLLRRRAFLMLRYYCLLRIGRTREAATVLLQYLSAPSGNLDLSKVDKYLESLLPNP